jgi:hypothetical protein
MIEQRACLGNGVLECLVVASALGHVAHSISPARMSGLEDRENFGRWDPEMLRHRLDVDLARVLVDAVEHNGSSCGNQ